MEKSKISIIVPVYNTEKYIERCIRSILNQSYKNMEIICVDDGSTDKSGAILDYISGQDNRITVIHNSNMGVSVARNTGLEKATGEYIGFVDSDDYIDKDMFQILMNSMLKNDVDIVTCNYCFDIEGRIEPAINKKDVPSLPIDIKDFLKYIYLRDVYQGIGGYLWTRLYKRNVLIDENNILKVKFKEEYGGADDIVFIAESNMQCKQIMYINQPLYYYYQREGSIVHDNKKQIETLTWPKSYEKIIELYIEEGVQQDIIDIIKRMYVYRCGKILESAMIEPNKYTETIMKLKKKIKDNLVPYFVGNLEHLERVQWMINLLLNDGGK